MIVHFPRNLNALAAAHDSLTAKMPMALRNQHIANLSSCHTIRAYLHSFDYLAKSASQFGKTELSHNDVDEVVNVNPLQSFRSNG